MVKGRGRFRKRCDVDGSLEISVAGSTRDPRLREWILESNVILPRLQIMVKNYDRKPGLHALLEALEDLARRVEKLEGEVMRLGNERTR